MISNQTHIWQEIKLNVQYTSNTASKNVMHIFMEWDADLLFKSGIKSQVYIAHSAAQIRLNNEWYTKPFGYQSSMGDPYKKMQRDRLAYNT